MPIASASPAQCDAALLALLFFDQQVGNLAAPLGCFAVGHAHERRQISIAGNRAVANER